jgi:DNA-binding transcriptional ArsR family regulator
MTGVHHHPTDASRATVRALAAFGVPHEEIASRLAISQDTLARHYRRELDTGRIEATARVAERLHQAATQETADRASVIAAIFWLKCRAGWREVQRHEVEVRTDVAAVLEARRLRAEGEP